MADPTPAELQAQLQAAQEALAAAQAALAAANAVSAPGDEVGEGPLDAAGVAAIRDGYAVTAASIEVGALVQGEPLPGVQIRIPIGMLNRHGLVAGATGTGKTRTLQGLAEQLSAHGVAVFAADIKGDLSGIATPGPSSPKLLERTESIGQDWTPASFPVEFFSLGGQGPGIPIRATVTSFGPILLSKVLGLNDTQESSLGLVFHYADAHELPLVDLGDLRSVLQWLTSDEGKSELAALGGLSKSTAGVILRELVTFADQGADVFFGEPEFDTRELLRTALDGRGIISLLEIPEVYDKPQLFSTFLMWLLADLFNDLPEVGDLDKPKLVFFFDEAHLLFRGASKAFLESITAIVRLIRSKGVGIVFVTQTPKDVPNDILAQLGSRIQHQLRAHTPDDAKTLRATVGTYPRSGYDLEQVLTSLATGEAIVTVMNEKGAPTPVAWTRLRAPQGSMSPSDPALIDQTVLASPLHAQYATAVDPESATELLTARMAASAERAAQEASVATGSARGTAKTGTTARAKKSKGVDGARVGEMVADTVDGFLGSRRKGAVGGRILRGIFDVIVKKR